jgi:hypothetical protein
MRTIFWVIIIILVASLCGCQSDAGLLEEQQSKLPPRTKVIEKQSSTWWVIEVGDKRYLAQWKYSYGAGHSWVLVPYQ